MIKKAAPKRQLFLLKNENFYLLSITYYLKKSYLCGSEGILKKIER